MSDTSAPSTPKFGAADVDVPSPPQPGQIVLVHGLLHKSGKTPSTQPGSPASPITTNQTPIQLSHAPSIQLSQGTAASQGQPIQLPQRPSIQLPQGAHHSQGTPTQHSQGTPSQLGTSAELSQGALQQHSSGPTVNPLYQAVAASTGSGNLSVGSIIAPFPTAPPRQQISSNSAFPAPVPLSSSSSPQRSPSSSSSLGPQPPQLPSVLYLPQSMKLTSVDSSSPSDIGRLPEEPAVHLHSLESAAESTTENVSGVGDHVAPYRVPLGSCDFSFFSWMNSLPASPCFPFYASDRMALLNALKPEGVIGDIRCHFNGVPLTEVELSMMSELSIYLDSLDSLTMAQARSQARPYLEPLFHFVQDSEPTLLTAAEQERLQGSFHGTIFDPIVEGEFSGFALRFLLFNEFCLEDTAAHMTVVRRWLCTRGFRSLNRQEMAPLLQVGGFYIAGHDLLCRPILVCRLDRLVRLVELDLGHLPPHIQSDVICSYGAYYFFFFRRHLAVASRIEQMLLLLDLGDVALEAAKLYDVIGRALHALLYLFPEFVNSVWIVDSSGRREPAAASAVFQRMIFVGSTGGAKIRTKIGPPKVAMRDYLHQEIDLMQLETLYGGVQPPICSGFDLPVSFSEEILNRRPTDPLCMLGCVSFRGVLRPRPSSSSGGDSPDKLPVSLRSMGAEILNYFNNEAVDRKLQGRQARWLWTALQKDSFCVLPRHGTVMSSLEVVRCLHLSNFSPVGALGKLKAQLLQRNFQLQQEMDLDSFPAELLNGQSVYWHGRDRKQRPILVINASQFFLDSSSPETMNQYLHFWLHFALDYLTILGMADQWNVVVDLQDVPALSLAGLVPFISRFTTTFPERLCRLFIYNSSFLLRRACDVLATTARMYGSAKVSYVSVDAAKEQILRYIPTNQLEKRFGGSAKNVLVGTRRMGDVPCVIFPKLKWSMSGAACVVL